MSKKNTKKRPITTRKGRVNLVRKTLYERDLDRLEKINQQLLLYKGTEIYMEKCEHALEILKRVNGSDYE